MNERWKTGTPSEKKTKAKKEKLLLKTERELSQLKAPTRLESRVNNHFLEKKTDQGSQ